MAHHRVLEPFGMTLDLDTSIQKTFARDLIIQAVTIVPKDRRMWSLMNEDFSVVRIMNDARLGVKARLHLLTVSLRKDQHCPLTTKVEWHFKKNQPVNLEFLRDKNGCSSRRLEEVSAQLHLTGVYISAPMNVDF